MSLKNTKILNTCPLYILNVFNLSLTTRSTLSTLVNCFQTTQAPTQLLVYLEILLISMIPVIFKIDNSYCQDQSFSLQKSAVNAERIFHGWTVSLRLTTTQPRITLRLTIWIIVVDCLEKLMVFNSTCTEGAHRGLWRWSGAPTGEAFGNFSQEKSFTAFVKFFLVPKSLW